MNNDTMTLRFWVWINGGAVKLALKPGQGLQHVEGGATEEGYDVTQTSWSHEGDHVAREWYRDARDCDGRMSNTGECVCPVAELRANEPYWYSESDADPAVMMPEWQNASESQRDYQAEAAGY